VSYPKFKGAWLAAALLEIKTLIRPTCFGSRQRSITSGAVNIRRAFDIRTTEPIEPPWQAIKEWIHDDEPDLDWFNRPRNSSNPDPDGIDQTQTWQTPEIQLDDGCILVLEST